MKIKIKSNGLPNRIIEQKYVYNGWFCQLEAVYDSKRLCINGVDYKNNQFKIFTGQFEDGSLIVEIIPESEEDEKILKQEVFFSPGNWKSIKILYIDL